MLSALYIALTEREIDVNMTDPGEKMITVRSKIVDAVVRDLLPWIEDNLSDETIRVKTVTQRSGYGHWHFQRIFRVQMGCNLAEYIRLRRISRAAFSVAFTNRDILDIAIENGFTSQQNFSRIFKKYLLIAPTIFRKACSGQEVAFRKITQNLHENHICQISKQMFFNELKN